MGVNEGAHHITQQDFRHSILVIVMTAYPQETPDLGQEMCHIPHAGYYASAHQPPRLLGK